MHTGTDLPPGVERFTRGELEGLRVCNQAAEAEIYLQGAQVARYQRRGQPPLLWCSPSCRYRAGRSLRGGIPVCWPWFGDAARNPEAVQRGLQGEPLPAHGLVRGLPWQLESVELASPALTRLRLALQDGPATRAHFPYAFALALVVEVGEALELTLEVSNRDRQPFAWSGALHTYFAVSDIGAVSVSGLEGLECVDTLQGWTRSREPGPVAIAGEVDRLYLGDAGRAAIEDRGWGRRIAVEPRGSRSCVLWNPWAGKALRLSDFEPGDYRSMLCLETARALDDFALIEPGQTQRLGVRCSGGLLA